jgi:hypothetical protein
MVNTGKPGQLTLTTEGAKGIDTLRPKRREGWSATINGEPTRTLCPPADYGDLRCTDVWCDNAGLMVTLRFRPGVVLPGKPIERGAYGSAGGEDGKSESGR